MQPCENLNLDKFYSVFQALPFPTYLWQKIDNQFFLRYINHEVIATLGEKANSLIGINATDLYYDNLQIVEKMHRCIQNKNNFQEELIYFYKTTQEHKYINAYYIYIDETTLVIKTEEITDRKNAEALILSDKEKFHQIIENIPVGLVIDNQRDKTLFYNKTFTKMFGYQAEDIPNIEIWWEKAYPNPEYRLQIQEEWKSITEIALKNNTVSEPIQAMIRCKNGKDKFSEGFFTKIGEEYITVFQDITELKKKELTLQNFNKKIISQNKELEKAKEIIEESEKKYKEAQTAAKIGSWETNISDLSVKWSEQTFAIFELSPETYHLTHQTFLEYVHPEDKKMVDDGFVASFQNKYYNTIQHRIITGKGNLKYVEEYWKVSFDENDQPIRVFGTCQDITERKIEEMEKNKIMQDLMQRNRDLEQFSYIVSHNLRSPVSNILGINHFLQDENITNQERMEWIHALNQSVLSMDTVIKDLSYILQIKKEINEPRERVIFSQLISDIEISISGLKSSEGVTIQTDFTAIDEMLSIRSYLYSIFYNLISNSIKYKQREVTPIINIRTTKEDKQFSIIFMDNGLGIDLEKRGDQVFGLYKRFHHHVDGKGVGLFMVKTQVETLGGKIYIASEVNKGTTFTITFDL